MKISEATINYILEKSESAYKHSKLPEYKKESFLLSLKSYLRTQGVMENVCDECMGTGLKENKE